MLRVGILSVAHMHAGSYVHAFGKDPRTEIVGIWDHDLERARAYAELKGLKLFENRDELIEACDAVCVCTENQHHLENVLAAAAKGKNAICEKPLVAREEDAQTMREAVEKAGTFVMTAFPCRFSPAFQRLKERVANGEIGRIRAISATNRGTCPWGWFVEKELSGGGAMIDHVVHVTDLIRDLLQEEPIKVQAQIGNNTYSQDWEDTAMVTMEFPSGIFATLDSSWSRPKGYKTWGDVTMTVVGEQGTIELDMFGPSVEVYSEGYRSAAYGSDLDAALIESFLTACIDGTPVVTTMHDGLQAARVALAGYRSVEAGQPVAM